MIKYGLIAAGVLLTLGVLWPLASSTFGKKPNEATNLVEATERTNNKAGSLNDTFTDIIPPAPPRRAELPAGLPAGPGSYTPGIPGVSQGAAGEPAGGPVVAGGNPAGAPGQPGGPPPGTPTPDPYEHQSEHAVRDAMEFLNKLQTEMEPNQTEYIQAVEQLQRAWGPRYERANDEYKRFARKIDHADAMAQEYFLIQRNLTAQIHNSKDRKRAEAIDASEHRVYLDWRDQAFKTLGQAKFIMLDLHDMNVLITKQSLSAHFAALYEEFQTIPPEITMLHQELARFREESDKIQQTFGVAVK